MNKGIHPWFVHQLDQESRDYVALLKSKITEYPNALVGEIGLDGIAKNKETGEKFPLEPQLQVFEHQFDVAGECQRPTSVHAVQVTPQLLTFFQNLSKRVKRDPGYKIPPTIMLHSFSGSPDLARQLVRLPRIGDRLYFSFSSAINGRSPKMMDRIRAIPDDRILLESDVHDIDQVDQGMSDILEACSRVKNWTMEETVDRVKSNTQKFLGSLSR
jgi:TatD DNase family protein